MEQNKTHEEHHPGAKEYIVIGVILTVITLVEVWAFYWTFLSAWILSMTILVLALVKFILVVGYYMHLKFDDRRFLALFAFPFVVATLVMIVLMALFDNLTR